MKTKKQLLILILLAVSMILVACDPPSQTVAPKDTAKGMTEADRKDKLGE